MFRKPCRKPGCPNLDCEDHADYAQARTQPFEGAAPSDGRRLLNTRAWRTASKRFLRANPLCVGCLAKGLTVRSRAVDHITPHRGDWDLFWDQDNWQALCVNCHASKTARGL